MLVKITVIACLLLAIFIGAGTYYFSHKSPEPLSNIYSPLPDNSNFFADTLGSSYWSPRLASAEGADLNEPEVTAIGALTYDIATEQLLYDKNSTQRLPMASLTKIMTAIIALENDSLDKKITITQEAAETGENAMGLTAGETLTLEELLYGLMLPSGNDAAEAIARGSSLGRSQFLFAMNKKAEDLGLTNTNFTNPSGLEGDGEQYTTAQDLLIISKYAMENPTFAKIVETYEHFIPATSEHKAFTLYNETNLLTTYPGVKGIKIGFTWEAGYCIVTYLDYKDHKIIGVLLNSQNRREEMKNLLDYSLRKLGVTPPHHI